MFNTQNKYNDQTIPGLILQARYHHKEIKLTSFKRRHFLKHSMKMGAGLSYFTLFPDQLFNRGVALADDVKEEKQKEKLARYVFNFSSPYFTADHLTTPHAHLDIKQLIETHTKNKIFVKIHDGGAKGIGSELSKSVSFGLSQGALLSVSNLAPMAPEVDILNIPFWCANETEYMRLFGSQLWKTSVLSKMAPHKIQVLFPYVVGERTATTTKRYGKLIKSPEDFSGIRFRIPGSKTLKVFYELAQATPVSIPWKHCAKTAHGGRYDALDPAVIGLYSGPGNLKKEIGIISEIASVHDGWVAIGNTDFIDTLDSQTRRQFFNAIEEIRVEQYKGYKRAKQACIRGFEELGVTIYTPTPKEIKKLSDLYGHANPAWEAVKKRLLGNNGLAVFDKLYRIAKA